VPVELRVTDAGTAALIGKFKDQVERMAKVTATFVDTAVAPDAAKTIVNAAVELRLPLAGLVDVAAERKRIAKELGKLHKAISATAEKLGNPEFIARASEEAVTKQRLRLAEEQAMAARLQDALATLGAAS